MTEPHKIWFEQCEAAEGIEDDFGTQQVLDYPATGCDAGRDPAVTSPP